MALINCPECGKEISDRAPACIHCGFPLSLVNKNDTIANDMVTVKTVEPTNETAIHNKNDSTTENRYSLELIDYGSKKVQVATTLKNNLKMKDVEALQLVASAPCYLFREKQEHIVAPIIKKLDTLPVEYNLFMDGKLKRHKTKVEIEKPEDLVVSSTFYTKKIKCPNCSALIEETSRMCPECGYDGISSYLLQLEREKQAKVIDYTHDYGPINQNQSSENVPKCPTCCSTKIKKISGLSKAGSVAMWGIFSRKVYKQWHCNNCGSEW